jgi:DNA mismatch repair ATPase MutS
VYDQLLASITVRDNLTRGESLYLSEIRRVRLIVDAVDRGHSVLALFDEVFRGTNIMDATEATLLLVDGLSRAAHGTFFIASHLAEVARARTQARGVACWCMGIDMSGNTPQFTYRMERGISEVHLGMMLLDAEGVGPILRRLAAR